jgi:NADH-quinone oxidoreductase subunit F
MQSTDRKILICSAAGDDPRAPINKLLCETKAPSIISGIKSKMAETSADNTILYIPAEWAEAVLPLVSLAAEVQISVKTGKDSLVCRDHTALLMAMEGKFIRPSLVDYGKLQFEEIPIADFISVEDAVHIGDGDKDKKYLFLQGAIAKEGLVNVSYGISLTDIISLGGGLDGQSVKAALVGGELGIFVKPDQFDMTIMQQDTDYFSGSVELLGQRVCAVDYTRTIISNSRNTSCGKCPLCREGTFQLNMQLNDIVNGKAKAAVIPLIDDMAQAIELGAFCQFGRSMARFFRSALSVFTDEIDDHIKRKKCPAGVCKAFLNLAILPDKCTGCGDCIDVCDEDAIEGKSGYIHMMSDGDCTKCGKCLAICKEHAIIAVGAIKPRLPKRLTKVGEF